MPTDWQPDRLRYLLLLGCCISIVACRDTNLSAGKVESTSRRVDTGRVVQQGSSYYAVIARDSCPGSRTVNTRFERVADLVVKIVEDNTQFDCLEGMISSMTAVVWRAGGLGTQPVFLDSIRGTAERATIVDIALSLDRAVPLLEGATSGCCAEPSRNDYWNLRTGKRVFDGETKIMHFIANGAPRFLMAAGGSGDTLGVVEYGTGHGEPQRVFFTREQPPSVAMPSDLLVVDSTALAGPRGFGGGIVIGSECCPGADTLPVSGVTLRLRVRGTSGDPVFDFTAKIVNDRLLGSSMKRP